MIFLLMSLGSAMADQAEVDEIRRTLQQMRSDYEQRIQALEQRLEQAEAATRRAENKAETTSQAQTVIPQVTASQSGSVSSGNAFNPQVSVIINGSYYSDSTQSKGGEYNSEAFQPSHTHAHDEDGNEHEHSHGTVSNGFNLHEAELAFSATVDPYFDANAYLAIDGNSNLNLEEAWFQTRNIPYGIKIKGGKFLSDFGYINKQHPHQWDFADQNLVYLNLLGYHGLQDTGVQLTWLPDWSLYTLFGVELLHGDQENFGATVGTKEQAELNLGSNAEGPRLWTAFVKIAPDLGYNHALQFGLSYAHNRQHQEVHEHTEGNEVGLAGDADLWGLDLVYKYDSPGSYGHGDLKVQTEYLRSVKNLTIRGVSGEGFVGPEIGSTRKFTTDGWYIQSTYGIAPRWQVGIRYDVLGLTNEISGGVNEDFGSSSRWSTGLSWFPTEFSTIRLQYSHSNVLVDHGTHREKFDTIWLQFLMSLGSHGAHTF
ncbi:porin [Achromatium sp. WMS1]|nr:porin [Achromatium sp. WMS1]